MDKKIDCVILENDKEYAIVEKIKNNNFEYLYLFNINDIKDFCIRKLVGEKIYGLDNDNEFDEALIMLKDKNKELLEKLGF